MKTFDLLSLTYLKNIECMGEESTFNIFCIFDYCSMSFNKKITHMNSYISSFELFFFERFLTFLITVFNDYNCSQIL